MFRQIFYPKLLHDIPFPPRVLRGLSRCKENTKVTFGTVKFFDLTKGFGMIAPDGKTSEIVVYQPEVDQAGLGQLAARQRLGFDVAASQSGSKAINLWATFGNR